MWILLLMAGMIILYLLPGMIFSKYWDKGLDVKIAFEEPFIFEGDESILLEEITNDKRLPILALAVRLSVSKSLRFDVDSLQNLSISDQVYKRDIFSLPFYARVRRRMPFKCEKRGFYEITGIDVTAYDYFFSGKYHMEVPDHSHIYVYPKVTDVSKVQMLNSALYGLLLTKRLIMMDPFTFSGIREYMKGDPMSQINWKASAKGQKLLVNQYDATTSEDVTILLDLEDRNIIKEEMLSEEAIRIAASLCESIVARRMTLRLASNAECLNYNVKAGNATMDDMFKAFAVVDTAKVTKPFAEIIEEELSKEPEDVIYIVISKNASREMYERLTSLKRQTRNKYLWILPYMPSHPERVREYGGEDCLAWEVRV